MKSKGLGDIVEKIIKKAGIWRKPCKACQKRKEVLNKIVPYGRRK